MQYVQEVTTPYVFWMVCVQLISCSLSLFVPLLIYHAEKQDKPTMSTYVKSKTVDKRLMKNKSQQKPMKVNPSQTWSQGIDEQQGIQNSKGTNFFCLRYRRYHLLTTPDLPTFSRNIQEGSAINRPAPKASQQASKEVNGIHDSQSHLCFNMSQPCGGGRV